MLDERVVALIFLADRVFVLPASGALIFLADRVFVLPASGIRVVRASRPCVVSAFRPWGVERGVEASRW